MPVASRYNIWSRSEDGAALLFNGLTGALLELTAEEEASVRAALAAPDEGRSSVAPVGMLLQAGCLVTSPEDELARLEARARRGRQGAIGTLELVVSPTWSCNFSCDYCYVSQRPGVMSLETEHAVARLVARSIAPYDMVEISWFGGEPLLRLDTVVRVSAAVRGIAVAAGKGFRFYATTNGYLLSAPVARRLVAAGVEYMHVTIDGTSEWHDTHRVLSDGSPTHATLVRNVNDALAAEPGLRVTVRSNVDEANVLSVLGLLEEFAPEHRSRIQVSVTPIKRPETRPSAELYRSINRVVTQALAMGYGYYGVQLPRARSGFCVAQSRGNFHIGPDGSLFCCTPTDAKPAARLGRLLPDGTPELVPGYEARYEGEPFGAECRECEHLPYCMGGCPLERDRPRDDCRTRYEDGEAMVRNLWRAATAVGESRRAGRTQG